MKFWARVIRTPEATLVNVCDENLLGKEFSENEIILRVTRLFYGEKVIDVSELKDLLEMGDIISLVGEKCISVAVEMGIATWKAVRRVRGVPHLNIYRL